MSSTAPKPLVDCGRGPGGMDEVEWQLRVQTAAAYRLIQRNGWNELIWGHTTTRLPGAEHQFLINPYGLRYDEVTASSLVVIDLDGNIVEPGAHAVNPAGFVIHSAIHRHRERARCVMHTHSRAGMAVASMRCGLLPISMSAISFHGHLAYHDFEGSTLLLEEREKLAADVGDARAVIMRNHGLLAIGATVPEAFLHLFRLEQACKVQVDAMSSGAELIEPPFEVIERSVIQTEEFARCAADGIGELEFVAFMRLLDAEDPSYCT